MPAIFHVAIGTFMLAAACLLQRVRPPFFDSSSKRYIEKYLSPSTWTWSRIVSREAIRFILLLVGATQLWAGIRDW